MSKTSQVLLSKSRYTAGLQCPRRLWLGRHRPDVAAEPDAARQAIFEMGHEVGVAAHALFPGGVLVDEPYYRHAAAEARTRALLADPDVPAIFEAAFTHSGVRIRVDLLERLGEGRFGLREVKASTAVKPAHVPDLAVQKFVLRGWGLEVPSAGHEQSLTARLVARALLQVPTQRVQTQSDCGGQANFRPVLALDKAGLGAGQVDLVAHDRDLCRRRVLG